MEKPILERYARRADGKLVVDIAAAPALFGESPPAVTPAAVPARDDPDNVVPG